MRSAFLQQPGPATAATSPAAAARAARTADADAAQLDARLEVAAKKAALASLEAQTGGVSADAPAQPGAPSGRILIERDDGTRVTLDNPTTEQLAQVGVGSTGNSGAPEGWQPVAITSTVMWAIVAIVWMILKHRRRGAAAMPSKQSDEMAARMARIENAIESVAVEVERISEGQRFTSRLLSEGAAVPMAVANRGDAVPANRAGL
jgi:hypothetical protein